MKKSVVLQALQTQLEKVKAAAVKHEKKVYEPAMADIKSVVSDFLSEICPGVDDVEVSMDRITVWPNPNKGWNNQIEIVCRSNWNRETEYCELSANRPEMQSHMNIAEPMHYYNTLNAIVNCFTLICNTYMNEWIPAMSEISKAKDAMYSPIWELESEIRKVEKDIAEEEKQKYFQTGTKEKLTGYKHFDWKWQNTGGHEYIIEDREKAIRMQYGRANYDYVYVHEFQVRNYPKAKHAKVQLWYKGESSDTEYRSIEINKARYEDFINSVYAWQTREAAEKTARAEERYAEKQKESQSA